MRNSFFSNGQLKGKCTKMLTAAALLYIEVVIVVSVSCSFVATPRNTAVLVGEKLTLECETNASHPLSRWTVTHQGSTSPKDIYLTGRGKVESRFPQFGVQFNENGLSVLYAKETELSDAGVFTCCRNEDEMCTSAQVIVLQSLPLCESSISAGSNLLPSEDAYIWMQCSLNFSGNCPPSMEWRLYGNWKDVDKEDSIIPGFTETTNRRVQSWLNVSAASTRNGSYFTCLTYFRAYNGSIQTTANNIPDFNFIWISPVITFHNLLYYSVTTKSSAIAISQEDISSSDVNSNSHNNWFVVSLSLVAVVSLVVIIMAVMAVKFYICQKRDVTDTIRRASTSKGSTLDDRLPTNYEILPYALSDGYDMIEEVDISEDIPAHFPQRQGALPTPGYDGLLPLDPMGPNVYGRMNPYIPIVDEMENGTSNPRPELEEKSGGRHSEEI